MKEIFRVENLSAGYKKEVVSSVSFSLYKGECVSLLGGNGQGKTTLLRGICGGAERFSGRIFYMDRDITDIKAGDRAGIISCLPGNISVPEGISVRAFVETALYHRRRLFEPVKKEDRERIEKISRLTDTEKFSDRDFSTLSQGQKQRVLICRILVQNTAVMFFDEPDASLDFISTRENLDMLKNTVKKEGRAGLFILHDIAAALNISDRIFIMDKGKIIDEISLSRDSTGEIQEKIRKIYPAARIEKNPYNGEYMCF